MRALPVCGLFLPADDNRSKIVLFDFHGVYNCELLHVRLAVYRPDICGEERGWLGLHRTINLLYGCFGSQTFLAASQIHQTTLYRQRQSLKTLIFAFEFRTNFVEGFDKNYED